MPLLRRDADDGEAVAVAAAGDAQEAAGGAVTVDLSHVVRSQTVGFARLIQINAIAPILSIVGQLLRARSFTKTRGDALWQMLQLNGL